MLFFAFKCKLVIKSHPSQFMLQWFWLTAQNLLWVLLTLRVHVQMASESKTSKSWLMLAPNYILEDEKPPKEDIYVPKDTTIMKWSN